MTSYLMREKENSVRSWVEKLRSTRDADSDNRKKARIACSRKAPDLSSLTNTKRSSRSSNPSLDIKSIRPTSSTTANHTLFADRSASASSLRTASSYSSPSKICDTSFEPEPYAFTPTWTSANETSSKTSLIASLGSKRSYKFSDAEESPSNRQKTEQTSMRDTETQWVPQYYIDDGVVGAHSSWSPCIGHMGEMVYDCPRPAGPVQWSTTIPLPEHLPHMTVRHDNVEKVFALPDEHDFRFLAPRMTSF